MEWVIIFHEKHGERMFDSSTEQLRNEAMLFMLKERVDDDYWYFDEDAVEAREIIDMAKHDITKAFLFARRFLANRRDYEYEGFSEHGTETPNLFWEK